MAGGAGSGAHAGMMGTSTTESTANIAETVYAPDYGFKKPFDSTEMGATPLLSADGSQDSMRAPPAPGSVADSTATGSRVIQHQDANDVVELPPPYIDRGGTLRQPLRLVGEGPSRTSIAGPSSEASSANWQNEKSDSLL